MDKNTMLSYFSKKLTVKDFDREYYEEHKSAGLDYAAYGYWQDSYAKMVSNATFQHMYSEPSFLDIGCACGAMLYGFKRLNLFSKIVGLDLNSYMISLGKKTFSFQEDELICSSASKIPLEDKSISLVHSAQVLEHIPEEDVDSVVKEIYRVMRDDGRAFISLDAVREDEDIETYMIDPTHVTLKSPDFWSKLFLKNRFYLDIECYDRYARAPYGPEEGVERPFFLTYEWSVWVLRKMVI